jgi:hypothetical protein
MFQDLVERLETVGRAMYGDNWQSRLARDLEVDPRTVRFWLSRKRPVPQHVGAQLRLALDAHVKWLRSDADELEELARKI